MSGMGISINSSPAILKQNAKNTIESEKKLNSQELKEMKKDFPSSLIDDDVKFNEKNQKISFNCLSTVNIVENWDTYNLKDKVATVMDRKLLSYPSDLLKKGDSKINYRFNADTEKNTFSTVKTAPSFYGKDKDFYFINGINTKKEECEKTASELSRLTGQNVKTVYNPTNGMIKDLKEASGERLGNKIDSISEKTGANFYATLHQGKGLKIISHSQGAAITADALKICEKMLLVEKQRELKSADPNISNFLLKRNSEQQVEKIMSKVEVITLGGAASQDNFPKVKLVEVTNPKDPIPQIAGNDLLQTIAKRKVISSEVGNVSYDKNDGKLTLRPKFSEIQNVAGGLYSLGNNICQAVASGIAGKNLIDYHMVSDGKDAYLNQLNTRSLLYNFGRQDFQTLK